MLIGADKLGEAAQQEYDIQQAMSDPIAFSASSNPDTMHLHEVMREPDKEQFMIEMDQEVNSHNGQKHWEVRPLSDVPASIKVLDAVGQ
jgi:hypothetical protein